MKSVGKVLRFIGFYVEDNHLKIDLRQVYFLLSGMIIIMLAYDAFFVQVVTMDNWGLASPYIVKFEFIGLTFIGIYYVWGYLRLLRRVGDLENKK